jgi:hypothetical protein
MLEASTTPQLQPPQLSTVGALLLTTGSEETKRAAMLALKVAPLPALISISFKTLAMASVIFTTTTPTRLTGVLRPVLGQKLIRCRATFGKAAIPTHAIATAMHFPANVGLIFLTDELTNDMYFLVDTGATLSIVPQPKF